MAQFDAIRLSGALIGDLLRRLRDHEGDSKCDTGQTFCPPPLPRFSRHYRRQ